MWEPVCLRPQTSPRNFGRRASCEQLKLMQIPCSFYVCHTTSSLSLSLCAVCHMLYVSLNCLAVKTPWNIRQFAQLISFCLPFELIAGMSIETILSSSVCKLYEAVRNGLRKDIWKSFKDSSIVLQYIHARKKLKNLDTQKWRKTGWRRRWWDFEFTIIFLFEFSTQDPSLFSLSRLFSNLLWKIYIIGKHFMCSFE